jgi:predicted glutamine amidotransferase
VTKNNKVSKENLHTSWVNNPHGAGYSFRLNNKVIYRKGFMKFNDFYIDYQKTLKNYTGEVIFHFRISTSASITASYTHPFIITENYKRMRKTEGTVTEGVFFHNGIFNNVSEEGDYITDSMSYTKEFVYPVSDLLRAGVIGVISLLEKTIRGNKIVLFYPEKTLILGGFIVDKDNNFYSNSTYKKNSRINDYYYNSWEDDKELDHYCPKKNTSPKKEFFYPYNDTRKEKIISEVFHCPICEKIMEESIIEYHGKKVIEYFCSHCSFYSTAEELTEIYREINNSPVTEKEWKELKR